MAEIDPKKIFPVPNIKTVTYIKPTLTRKNIIAGEFSYYAGENFESRVTHHYDFIGDKLIIGKFCQIGEGVNFIMNGANHKMNCATTYPFYIFEAAGKPATRDSNARRSALHDSGRKSRANNPKEI